MILDRMHGTLLVRTSHARKPLDGFTLTDNPVGILKVVLTIRVLRQANRSTFEKHLNGSLFEIYSSKCSAMLIEMDEVEETKLLFEDTKVLELLTIQLDNFGKSKLK